MEAATGTHTFEVLGTRFTIDKKYVPTKALGKGAYGVVCACRNAETGSKVAIKRISPMAASRVDGLHVLREIRLMRWLGKHPNIITLKDLMVNVEGDELYLVMELYDAGEWRCPTGSVAAGICSPHHPRMPAALQTCIGSSVLPSHWATRCVCMRYSRSCGAK